jgi:hypothetical protein
MSRHDHDEKRRRREMKIWHGFGEMWSEKTALQACFKTIFPVVMLGMLCGITRPACAQVVPAADAGGTTLSAGATVSGFYLQYGERKMLGATGFADYATRRHLGIEGEARWLVFHQTDDVHAVTYSIGPLYSFHSFGRFLPYAKGLVGFGQFTYPYNDGKDNDLVVTPGGGVDYRLSRRIHLRLADFEYQYWPQFHYGAMSSFGVSSGIRVRIF